MKKKLIEVPASLGRAALICMLACLCVNPSTYGQTKRKATRPKARTTAPAPEPAPPPVNFTAESAFVAEQIKIVTRFVYVYGKVANGLELAEEQLKRGELSPTAQANNRKTKDAVVTNINGVRTGLETLASRFQANVRLQVQYLKLSYAAEAAANAERLVTMGRFDEAGKSLVVAVERLAEVMQALR